MQYRHRATIIKLNYSLRFLNKGFVHYLWHDLLTTNAALWHVPDSPGDKSACKRSPCNCNLKLGSMQQVKLLTVELRSKHAIL